MTSGSDIRLLNAVCSVKFGQAASRGTFLRVDTKVNRLQFLITRNCLLSLYFAY